MRDRKTINLPYYKIFTGIGDRFRIYRPTISPLPSIEELETELSLYLDKNPSKKVK